MSSQNNNNIIQNNNEQNVKGRNWGNLNINQWDMIFEADNLPWFSIPLNKIGNVQQASNKNEITLEFNMDDASNSQFNLCEMRLYVPDKEIEKNDNNINDNNNNIKDENINNNDMNEEIEENSEEKSIKKVKIKTSAEFVKEEILKKANIGTVSDSITNIHDIPMIIPRGKFDLYFMKNTIKIHGQTHNYSIPNKHINKVFLLPKNDAHNHYLIVKLIKSLSQGNTSYPFLIFQIKNEQEISVNLNFENSEQNETISGKLIDVMAKLFYKLINVNIIVPPKNFSFYNDKPYIKCVYKANEGILYPLEKSILFVHKPVKYIAHEDIREVRCARLNESGSLKQRTFDITILTKNEEINFNGVEKEELDYINKYFQGKKITINMIDEDNNTVPVEVQTSRRNRQVVDEAPMDLPSEEELIGDNESESSEYDEDEGSDDDGEEDGDYEGKKKQKKK